MKWLPLILTKSNLNLKQKGGGGVVLLLLPPLLPAFVRTCPPSFTHSHSSTSTHPIPLTAPILCSVPRLLFARSHSPAPTSPLTRLCLSICPRSLVHACLGPLIRACSRSFGIRSHSFVLTCPAYSCLFPSSFGLHSCSFVPARLFACLAFVWPPFVLVCACSPRLLALICVCIKYMVSTYIMNRLTFLS